MSRCKHKPCKTCPWRRSSTTGGADIPGFDMQKMHSLKNTVPPRGTQQDGFFNIMACHHSKEGEEIACAGYLMQEGQNNLNVRMMGISGDLDWRVLTENCENIPMYSSFYEMLDDYEKVNNG